MATKFVKIGVDDSDNFFISLKQSPVFYTKDVEITEEFHKEYAEVVELYEVIQEKLGELYAKAK
jgi:hypothetical protein